MFAASKSGSADAKDAQFNYVTMLLHGNGTNGAQNNTFVDSSTNNFTITRNGNTTQGTFTPYGSNWSNYFDGSSAVVNRSNNTALAMGTGDFTIEFWMNAPSTGAQVIYDNRLTTSSSTGGFNIYIDTGVIYAYGGATTNVSLVSGSYTANQWNHIAIVRSGSGTGNVKLYINGTLASTYGSADTANYSLGYLAIGAFYNPSLASFYTGYLSNLRFVKGTAVYTSSFTPSTTPLTAITNTSLLTCQSNRFIDNSSNAFAITTSGSPSVQRFSPFSPTTAYSTSVIGGSGYFDGSGDYLTAPNNTAFDLSTSDFTISYWIYPTSTSAFALIATYANGVAQNSNYCFSASMNAGGAIRFDNFSGNTQFTVTGGAVALNTWNFVTITRSGASATVYVNNSGTTGTVSSSSNVPSSSVLYIGTQPDASNPFSGYLSNFRIVKGSATAPGANPTSPLTAVSGTSLLLSYTNAGILDNAMMNDLETVGNAQISTSVKKYGTGSMYFDGTTDYIVEPTNLNFGYGTGDFTIEFWLYLNATGDQTIVSNLSSASSVNPHIYYASAGSIRYYTNGADRITGSALSTSTWYHIAICRASGSTKMFINGTQSGSTYTDANNYGASAPLGIGTYWSAGSPVTTSTLNGYIDDLRITKGYARYTANFTAPTAAFPDKG